MALHDKNGVLVKVGDLVEIETFDLKSGVHISQQRTKVKRLDIVLAINSRETSPRHNLRTAGILGANKHAGPRSRDIRVVSSLEDHADSKE